MDKFNKIVQKMNDLDGYLVPHNDAHQSEYIAECDERLAYISNFDGSNGLGLIMKDKAYLWTDSRYYIQAKNQLQEPWQMLKMEELPWFNFVVENYPNSKIGYDPNLLTAQNVETRTQFFKEKNIQFLPIEQNLIDIIWTDKPKIPLNQIFLHEKQFCGLHAIEKLQKLKVKVLEKNCNLLLTSKLDEIAWTLNLRGSDIEFNPVFFSFLIIDFSQDIQGTLFINDQKVPNEIKEYLQKECNIQIKQYDEINNYLKNFNNGKICLSKNSINQHIFQQIQDSEYFENCDNQIDLLKEIKGQREMEGMKECHVYDGVALVQFLSWLENEILVNKQSINEYQAAQKAKYFREQQKYNVGLSFETISSTGPNAAIIHYKPSKDKSSTINPDQIYLVDSGGQYKCGTTDVTRTIHMKQPTQDEIKAYTLVLQGNLDIEQQIWNINNPMNGADLDILARKRLIENGMNYGHGTGHGVGYYLNVHEGPQGISKLRTQPFQHGLIVSNEPGYYKEGFFGIRIENLIMCVQKNEQLGFINLTLCPYDRKLIDKTMCTWQEIDFINNYHQRCWNELSQFLEKDLISLNWLKTQTQAL